MRTIANSRAYQASIATNEWNAERPRQLLARHSAAAERGGIDGRGRARRPASGRAFPEAPAGTRAEQLTDPHIGKDGFLDVFGRPPRESSCECERRSDLSLPQALNLVNGTTISDAVADPNGRVAQAGAERDEPIEDLVEELYLASLSRPPTPAEMRAAASKYLRGGAGRAARAQDLLWALVNSKAFLYNY